MSAPTPRCPSQADSCSNLLGPSWVSGHCNHTVCCAVCVRVPILPMPRGNGRWWRSWQSSQAAGYKWQGGWQCNTCSYRHPASHSACHWCDARGAATLAADLQCKPDDMSYIDALLLGKREKVEVGAKDTAAALPEAQSQDDDKDVGSMAKQDRIQLLQKLTDAYRGIRPDCKHDPEYKRMVDELQELRQSLDEQKEPQSCCRRASSRRNDSRSRWRGSRPWSLKRNHRPTRRWPSCMRGQASLRSSRPSMKNSLADKSRLAQSVASSAGHCEDDLVACLGLLQKHSGHAVVQELTGL